MSKPQLTTYSKAVLLMHRNKYVCDRPRDDKMSASEFFKYLLISRQFIRAFQLYQVYQFVIDGYCSDDHKFFVTTQRGSGVGAQAVQFKLKLKKIRSLNRLLNVQYVGLYRYEYKYAQKFLAINSILGHIALDLYYDSYAAKNHSSIVKQVQKQLYSLRGNADSFYISPHMPQLDLAFADVRISDFYLIDKYFFDDFPTCLSVEELLFILQNLIENYDLVSKITKMIPFFPNLRELLCSFSAEHYTAEQFSLQKLVAWIRDECKKLEELQKTKLPITDMAIYYNFKIRKPESSRVGLPILKTTEFYLRDAELVNPKPDNNDEYFKQHYAFELWQKKSNFRACLKFTVDLDPIILDNEDLDENVSSADEDD
ncbi:hypothetical protein M3Y96_00200500 [Aphelenchoides besseyi]|nr:hypothetical protein M3Y96_00200500 [Aphelenchoides besseyi]